MTRIIFIKSFNYQIFKKNEYELLFSYIPLKIRLSLPVSSRDNQKIILNDGLPLEFIINSFNSNSIVNNPDITIHDLSVKTFNHQELFRYLNQFVQTFRTDNIVIVSTSGNENSISDDEIEVPVLFVGSYFKNKFVSKNITYTINDVAITINDWYDTKVVNARGQVIQFYDKETVSSKNIVNKQDILIKHIILFASDAFGSYLLHDNKLPNLNNIINNGASTLQVHSVIPTVSAVNWNSIMRGLSPNLHGFLEWNSFPPEITPVLKNKNDLPPSLFSLVKAANPTARTCAFFRWPQWQHIIELENVDYYYNPIQTEDIKKWGQTPNSKIVPKQENVLINENIVNTAITYIKKEKPFLSLIYVNEPDTTGHELGHQTPAINKMASTIDQWVGQVVTMIESDKAMKDNTLFVFLADHGGVGLGAECHGGISKDELEVPLICYGKMIRKHKITIPLMQYDFVKTLASYLQLIIPQQWNGLIIPHLFIDEYNLTGLVLYARDAGNYALYDNGENIFLMFGYEQAIKKIKIYAKNQNIKTYQFYDIYHNLTVVEL